MDTSKFDEYFRQVKERDARTTATRLTLDPVKPDDAAEGVMLGKELGVPPGQVMAAPQMFKDRLAQERATKALADAPKLTDWLRSDPVGAAMAKDDLDNLSWFERGLRQFGDMFPAAGKGIRDSQIGRGVETGVTGAKQMATAAATVPLVGSQATLLSRLNEYDRAASLPQDMPRHEIAATLGIDPMSPTAALVADFVAGDAERRQWHLERAARAVTSNKELMGTLTDRVQAYQKEMQATQGRVPNFTDINDVSGFFDWMGFNVGQAAPYLAATLASGVVAGPAGPMATGYAMGVGDIRAEQITSGQDPFDTEAAGAAVAGAVPYAALEYLGPAAAPFRGVSGPVLDQVATGFFRRAMRDVPQNAVEEFINETGQEIIKDFAVQMGGGDDVVLSDETLLKWFNAGMAGAASGAAMSPASTAITQAQQREMQRAERTGQTAELLDQVSQQAQASQLRARDPEAFKAALDSAGVGDQSIYLPAAELREFFQAKDTAFSPEDWGIDPQTFAEMEITGGRVAMPMSDFAAKIAGVDPDFEGWVRENASMDPEELSVSEAASYGDLVPADLADAYERELQDAQAERERQASDVQVYDGVYSMLRAAGRTVDVAQREAQVMAAYFRTQAERLGEDALELARRFNLDIRGPEDDTPARRRNQLDVMLNDLRAGKKEKTGPSLIDFVIGAGGVQDTGGDVAALEVKGLVKETAEQIRARQSQPTMPGMMPATGRGLPLDELGRKAVEAGYFPELMGEVAGLNDGEAADLGAVLLEALREEAGGNPRYREGDGPDPARAALNEELQRRGLDPTTMSNDEIAAALEVREFAQAATVDVDGVELPLNPDGTVTLYHGTTAAGAEGIIKTKTLRADAEPSVYLTTAQSSDGTGYGDGTVVAVDVKPDQLRIDDEFPDGRVDFAIDSPRARIVRARIVGREYGQERRGSVQFPAVGPDGRTTIINLFQQADLSTFLHESAHYFLEVEAALAADPAAPQQMREDMAAIREYLGAEEGQPFTVEQHETWARSFEAYMMEGKAPSLALADVFARARAWLTRIYRSIAGLDVKLTPQIREVMDRMLATDAEIAAAREETAAGPLFRERPPGMSDADWATYQRMARRSAEQAEAKLLEKTMAAVRRRTEKWWKDERKQVRAEVEARTNALPQHRLIEAMANGRFLTEDGERPAPDVRINRKLLVEQFGEGVLAELSRNRLGGKRAIYGEEGLSPTGAASMFGFPNAATMIEVLQNTGKRLDAIEAETDRIMLDRYGDPFTDGSIEQEALDAIHNDQTQQKHVAEARAMATSLGRDTRGMTSRLYRQRARLMLGRMTVREATASARFLAAERKAGRTAERAFAAVARGDAGRLAEALQAKEQQILNAALYDLSRQAEAEVSRARERFQDYGKKSVRQKLEGGYIEQIDDILDRFDFRKRGPGAVAKSERLRDFVQRMTDEGREAELAIDDRLMDEARRIHYSRLSLDELRGVIDTVANLDHLGRFKQKLINGKKQRDLNETAEAVARAIEDNVGTGKAKGESKVRTLLDLVFTADTVLVDMDGGDEFGASYQAIKEDIDAGYVRVDEMNRALAEKLQELFKVYSSKDIADMKRERHISGTRFTWTKWQAISVALNTGNDDNMARLLAEDAHPDQRISPEDLTAILDTLDKRDWDFVQSTWDLINGYWPEIEAVTMRRTGVRPGKVEARQVETKFGTYRGGYYPIRYDAGYGHAAAMDARTEMDKFMSAGRSGKAQTKNGHTVERKKTGNGRTLMLDMDVAFRHLRDVVRDIALSEAVDNAYRVLNHGRVAQAFIDAGRANDHQMLNLWLKDVATGPIVHSDPLNMFARIVKNNFTLSRLGLNLKTAALQVTGVSQSAATVGKANMARSFADYLKRPAEFSRDVMDKSEFMRRRQTTFDKDIHDFANDTTIASPMAGRIGQAGQFLARVGFAPLTKVQFYAVDVPTWIAGYRTGMQKFSGDEGRAVAYADRMVARAQDSGAMPDRSAVSRGTLSENVRQVEWVRLFTTLQGYFIAKMNRGYLTARQGIRDVRSAETPAQKFGAAADMATNMMLIYVAEAAMMGLAYSLMADDDDDLDGEKVAGWLLKETAGAVIGGLPIIRDGWSVLTTPYGSSGGVYGSITEIPAEVWKQSVQGENDRGFRRAVADAVGIATGFPTTAVLRPIEEIAKGEDASLIEALFGRNPLTD